MASEELKRFVEEAGDAEKAAFTELTGLDAKDVPEAFIQFSKTQGLRNMRALEDATRFVKEREAADSAKETPDER
jgi:Pyruvate/2-oxoacid:ferredoxin oxidoreductase gamma subunit